MSNLNEMVFHNMVMSQACLMALKDLVIEDISSRGANPEKVMNELDKSFSESVAVYQKGLIAQMKNRFGGLGSIDDLLNNITT